MSGQRGDTDCLARSGLFIDDDNWFVWKHSHVTDPAADDNLCIPRSSVLIDERGAAESQNARRMLGTLSQLVADLDGGPRSGRLELERSYPSSVSRMTVGPSWEGPLRCRGRGESAKTSRLPGFKG